mgnify:CR=1 FL=1
MAAGISAEATDQELRNAVEGAPQVIRARARLSSLRQHLEKAEEAAQRAREAEEKRRAHRPKLSEGIDFDLNEIKTLKVSPSPLAKCVICSVATLLDPKMPGSEALTRKKKFADWAAAQICLARKDFKHLLLHFDPTPLLLCTESIAAVRLRIAPEDPGGHSVAPRSPRTTGGAIRKSLRELIRPDGVPNRPLTALDVSMSSRTVQQLHRWCSRVLSYLNEPPPLAEEELVESLIAEVAQAVEEEVEVIALATKTAERERALRQLEQKRLGLEAAALSKASRAHDDLSPRARRLAEESRLRKAIAQGAGAATSTIGP